MKLSSISVAVLLALSTTTFAGTETLGKEIKAMPETPCFADHEFQLDIFGAYVDGNGLDHAGPWQDHGWGGGVGLNYFFTRTLGIGVDGMALYGRENRQDDGRQGALPHAKHTTIYSTTGSLILRFPMEESCLAPYIYVGGGYHSDGDEWASAHGGIGLEYRIVPQRCALFIDGRFTWFGDRYDNGDQNNYLGKAGIRFIF